MTLKYEIKVNHDVSCYHNKRKQLNEPIRTRSKNTQPARLSAGKMGVSQVTIGFVLAPDWLKISMFAVIGLIEHVSQGFFTKQETK